MSNLSVAPIGAPVSSVKPASIDEPAGTATTDDTPVATFFAVLAALVPGQVTQPPTKAASIREPTSPTSPEAAPDTVGGMLSGIARAVVSPATPPTSPTANMRVSTIVSAAVGSKLPALATLSPDAVDGDAVKATDSATDVERDTASKLRNAAAPGIVAVLTVPIGVTTPSPPLAVGSSRDDIGIAAPDNSGGGSVALANAAAATLRELLDAMMSESESSGTDAPALTATIEPAAEQSVAAMIGASNSLRSPMVSSTAEVVGTPSVVQLEAPVVAATAPLLTPDTTIIAVAESVDAPDPLENLTLRTTSRATGASQQSGGAAPGDSAMTPVVPGHPDSSADNSLDRGGDRDASHRELRRESIDDTLNNPPSARAASGRNDGSMNVPVLRDGGVARPIADASPVLRMQTAAPDPTPIPLSANQVTVELDSSSGAERIRVAVRGGLVHATILTDATRADSLNAQLPDLRRALMERGFTDARVSVRVPTSSGETAMAAPLGQSSSVESTRPAAGNRESGSRDEPAAERRQADTQEQPPRGGRRREPEEDAA